MRRSVPDDRLGEESEGDSRFNLSHRDKIATIQRADSTDGMQQPHPFPASSDPLPASFLARLAGFAHLFTRPTWFEVDEGKRSDHRDRSQSAAISAGNWKARVEPGGKEKK